MTFIGQAIAFAALCAVAAWLEINNKPASGLWTLVVCWAIFGDWFEKGKK